MGFQVPSGSMVIELGEDGSPTARINAVRVRMDLWPTWLEIGCVNTNAALAAGQQLKTADSDGDKGTLLSGELQAGLVAITAFAFAMDGFYDTVRGELGQHPDQAAWKKAHTSRAAQVS